MNKKIIELQTQIEKTKKELEEITQLEKPLPEFIDTTNVLRSNEYYTKKIEKQSELLIHYEKYSKELENLVLSAIDLRSKITKLKIRSKRSKTKRKIKKKPSQPRKKPIKSKLKIKKKSRKFKQTPRKKRS